MWIHREEYQALLDKTAEATALKEKNEALLTAKQTLEKRLDHHQKQIEELQSKIQKLQAQIRSGQGPQPNHPSKPEAVSDLGEQKEKNTVNEKELREKLEALEQRVAFLENTFSTLSDINASAEAAAFLEKRQQALKVASLLNAAAGDQKIQLEGQQRELERVAREKQELDARIAETLKNEAFSVPEDDSVTSLFSCAPYQSGVEITAFAGFNGKEEIAVPGMLEGKPVLRIGDNAFKNVDVVKIYLPDKLRSIGKGSFEGCKNLKSVRIPASVTEIGDSAFSRCTSLKQLELPQILHQMGAFCFSHSGLEQITIPSGVWKLESYCFSNCSRLDAVVLNEGLAEIGFHAFESTRFNSIILPSSVKTIAEGTFIRSNGEPLSIAVLGSNTDLASNYGMWANRFFSSNTTIYCKQGSTIQKTAREMGVKVQPLSAFQS